MSSEGFKGLKRFIIIPIAIIIRIHKSIDKCIKHNFKTQLRK